MESPQIENGYVKIANELWEGMGQICLSGQEWQIINCVIRKTYGYNKKEDAISLTQFQKYTGMRRSNCCRAIKKLVSKQILVSKQGLGVTIYGFNKLYTKWTSSQIETSLQIETIGSPQIDNRVVSKQRHTIDNITKDNIQNTKENIKEKDFDLFWKEYPIKKGKGSAERAFKKVKVDISVLLSAIESQKKERQMKAELKIFVPEWKYPATWLNQRCWEDEVAEIKNIQENEKEIFTL